MWVASVRNQLLIAFCFILFIIWAINDIFGFKTQNFSLNKVLPWFSVFLGQYWHILWRSWSFHGQMGQKLAFSTIFHQNLAKGAKMAENDPKVHHWSVNGWKTGCIGSLKSCIYVYTHMKVIWALWVTWPCEYVQKRRISGWTSQKNAEKSELLCHNRWVTWKAFRGI